MVLDTGSEQYPVTKQNRLLQSQSKSVSVSSLAHSTPATRQSGTWHLQSAV